MKNSMEIYRERLQMIIERRMLNKKLKKNKEDLLSLQKECSHDLVLVFDDHKPHKIGVIYRCFCPVCGKSKNIYGIREFDKSEFKDSKIMNLTSLSIDDFNNKFSESYEHILNYIFSHYNYYYNENHSEDEMSRTLLSFIKQKNTDENAKTLKKTNKKA